MVAVQVTNMFTLFLIYIIMDSISLFLTFDLELRGYLGGALGGNSLGVHLGSYPEDPYISYTYFHSQTLADELKRNADSLGEIYSQWLCNFRLFLLINCFRVVNAGMGILTGIGLLLLFGMPYNDIVAVMPFLVVAVGTDNMFLMVSAVRRTPRDHSVGERMAECMADAAVSILITATTDAFSFGVGAITTIPAVQIFCVYTGVSIAFTFIYQITFFAALLAIFTKYAPVLMNPIVRGLAMVWFIIYLMVSYYGCTQIREGLEPINLLVDDSYAIPHYKLLQEYFWKYGATLQIVVNNAPDLRNATARDRIKAMIGDFSTTRHSIGMESVQCWINDMERYYHEQLDMPTVDSAFYGMLQHYLASKHNNPWVEDLFWDHNANGEDIVKSFRFVIGLRDISFYYLWVLFIPVISQNLSVLREIQVASRWPEYNITTFMPLWLFTDQYAIVVPNTNIIIALLCMVLIALVLIPQPMCALWVALACGSIDFGVVGFMTLWGVNLDAISMITIIMSIGFSVDYSAHITYGYVVSEATIPREKIRDALSALGWPLFQGGLSTILAVSVLVDVPAYMIVTFFKTVVLSISIGLLHGLVFLPVLLSIFVRGCCVMETPRHSPIHKAKITPMVEKGILEGSSHFSSTVGYGSATPSLHICESPQQDAHYIQLNCESPNVHNRSKSSVKSPLHVD
uniref:SSD domain-containing protein n=1 Tax=Heterorhabditis bacteriophora TaxID=37862 RepID=A0A1I7XNF1_HETBA